ncbi:hypothetical protein [Micromonospora psammae]|uniref:hypothetical protein n=1 Tax=Micromonospora sp. CPCC 205556 TaxID=3122398 RepID=UPI002FF13159
MSLVVGFLFILFLLHKAVSALVRAARRVGDDLDVLAAMPPSTAAKASDGFPAV